MTVAHICCSTSEFAAWSLILYNSHKMSQVVRACQEVSGVSDDSSVGCKSCSQERQPAGSIWGLNEACCTLNRARRLGLMMTKDQTGGGGGQGSEKRSLPFLKVGVVQLLSHVRLFVTPWTVAHQASLSFTISWSLLKFMSFESVILSSHLILCCLLLLLPSIFPSTPISGLLSWLFSGPGTFLPKKYTWLAPLPLSDLSSRSSSQWSPSVHPFLFIFLHSHYCFLSHYIILKYTCLCSLPLLECKLHESEIFVSYIYIPKA